MSGDSRYNRDVEFSGVEVEVKLPYDTVLETLIDDGVDSLLDKLKDNAEDDVNEWVQNNYQVVADDCDARMEWAKENFSQDMITQLAITNGDHGEILRSIDIEILKYEYMLRVAHEAIDGKTRMVEVLKSTMTPMEVIKAFGLEIQLMPKYKER